MRNRIAEILLFLSWPVELVHRVWNNEPFRPVRWIIFDRSVFQDFRWYWVANEIWLSEILVLAAMLIMKSKTFTIRTLLRALVIVALIDIVNYWLFFRRQEWFLTAEGLVMIVATYNIFKHDNIPTTTKNA